jgi:DHA3 family macrolide efflux protein-like MFS transporter
MTEENNMGNNKFLGWERKTAIFLSSQTISLFGSSLVQFAIIWYIAKTTNSGIMVTISTICSFLPQLFISLFAGVWADRYNRKLLIVLSDGLIALSTLILAIIFFMGYKGLGLIFLISAIRSFGTGVQTPAVSAFIPQMVPEEKLMRINGINGTIQSLVFLVSPAASGAILSNSAFEYILFIDVITAAFGITLLLALALPAHKKALDKPDTDYFHDLKEGIKYSFGNKFIRNLLIFYALFMFLVVPAAFLNVLMVTRVFGNEYWQLTANEMAFFAGSMVGGVIIASWGGFKNRIVTLIFGCCAFGVLTVAIGIVKVFYAYLGIMLLTGITMPMFNSPSMVLLQEKVAADMQGRVFSLIQIVSSGIMPLGMLIFGPLADVVRIEVLMIITGVMIVILSMSMFLNKSFIKEGIKAE